MRSRDSGSPRPLPMWRAASAADDRAILTRQPDDGRPRRHGAEIGPAGAGLLERARFLPVRPAEFSRMMDRNETGCPVGGEPRAAAFRPDGRQVAELGKRLAIALRIGRIKRIAEARLRRPVGADP